MTKLRRLSLTAYEAPLCETIVDCPEPKGSEVLVRIERCGVCHSDLHMQDGYFAARRRQDARRARRTHAAVHARPRDRGHRRKRRARRRRRQARRQGRGLSLDRLRRCAACQRRRGESLLDQPPSRHLGRRRLRHARAGAASALPDRLRAAVAVVRRRADVLGPHRLFRAQAAAASTPRAALRCSSAWAASA